MERGLDIRKDLYAKVVLSGGVAMIQVFGEQMAKECDVSYAKEFVVFSNSDRRSQVWAQRLTKLRRVLDCT